MKTFDDLDLTEYYPETPYRAMTKVFFERVIKQFKKEAIKAGIAGSIRVETKNVSADKSCYGDGEGTKFAYTETNYYIGKKPILNTIWLVSDSEKYGEYGQVGNGYNSGYYMKYNTANIFSELYMVNPSHPKNKEGRTDAPKSKVLYCECVVFKAKNNWDSGEIFVKLPHSGKELPTEGNGGWVSSMFGEKYQGSKPKRKVLFIERMQPKLLDWTSLDVYFVGVSGIPFR